MNKFIPYIAIVLTILGVLLTAQKPSEPRLIGFIILLLTNVYWIWFNWKVKPMVIQFSLFIIISIIGIINNYK